MENFKAFGTITQLITDKIQDNHRGQGKHSSKANSQKGLNPPISKKAKSYSSIKEEDVKNPESVVLPKIMEKNESLVSNK